MASLVFECPHCGALAQCGDAGWKVCGDTSVNAGKQGARQRGLRSSGGIRWVKF